MMSEDCNDGRCWWGWFSRMKIRSSKPAKSRRWKKRFVLSSSPVCVRCGQKRTRGIQTLFDETAVPDRYNFDLLWIIKPVIQPCIVCCLLLSTYPQPIFQPRYYPNNVLLWFFSTIHPWCFCFDKRRSTHPVEESFPLGVPPVKGRRRQQTKAHI